MPNIEKNTERMVTLEKCRISYRETRGDGPAIFFVHGNSSSNNFFFRQLSDPAFTSYRMIAIDLPGHGNSGWFSDSNQYSLHGFADIVVEISKKLGIKKSVFVGHSLGGHILIHASDRLDIQALLIFGTPPISLPPRFDQMFLPNPYTQSLFKDGVSDEEVKNLAQNGFEEVTPHLDSFMRDFMKADPNMRLHLGQSLAALQFSNELQKLENLHCPLGIFQGARDRIINPEYFSSLKLPTLWKKQVHLIPDCGHYPHIENPIHFSKLLKKFVSEAF